MRRFSHLHPETDLENKLIIIFIRSGASPELEGKMRAFLELVEQRSRGMYEHSIRVALLASQIGGFVHLDPIALSYAGLIHEVGRVNVDPAILAKRDRWSASEVAAINTAVSKGHEQTSKAFPFETLVSAWHHRFRPNMYPGDTVASPRENTKGSRLVVPDCGLVLSIADAFDECYGYDGEFEPFASVGERTKERLLYSYHDHQALIEDLYKARILITDTYPVAKVAV